MLGPQASDSPFRQLPKTSMKKPLIQNIRIVTKEERVCYISGVSLRFSNLFGWWDGGMAKTSVNQNSSLDIIGRLRVPVVGDVP